MKSDYDFEKKLIIEQLLDVPEGDMITYSQLSALSGLNLQGPFRYLLDSSLDFVLKQHRMVFRNIRNTGYKRLSPPEIVDDNRAQSRICSAVDKGTTRLVSADFARLSDQHQKRHNARLCSMALVKLAATEKTVKKIEAQVKDAKETTIEARKALESLLLELS